MKKIMQLFKRHSKTNKYFVEDKKNTFAPQSVLLGEDNPLIVRMLKKLLEERGFCVTAVEDGSKALNYLKSYTYTWALLDLVLPEMEALQLVTEYREWEKACKKSYMPCFGLTGYPFKEIAHVCKKAGMDAVFEKPFTLGHLNIIESFLLENKRV